MIGWTCLLYSLDIFTNLLTCLLYSLIHGCAHFETIAWTRSASALQLYCCLTPPKSEPSKLRKHMIPACLLFKIMNSRWPIYPHDHLWQNLSQERFVFFKITDKRVLFYPYRSHKGRDYNRLTWSKSSL